MAKKKREGENISPIKLVKVSENHGNVTFQIFSTVLQRRELMNTILKDCTISWDSITEGENPDLSTQYPWIFSGIIKDLDVLINTEEENTIDSETLRQFKKAIRPIF